jgi:glycerol-3-phosphate dehydrogenase
MGNVLVGSTDIPVDNPDAVEVDDEEKEYMLEELQQLFPSIGVSSEQIVYHYVGVRPLPESDADKPGEVSRDHSLIHDTPDEDRFYPILSLVGGKWTTFRAFAREVSEEVLDVIGRSRTTGTKERPVGEERTILRMKQLVVSGLIR